jgi:hypothetical protein
MAAVDVLEYRHPRVGSKSEAYDEIIRELWKEHGKHEGYSLREFAQELGMAECTGGKWLADVPVYVTLKTKDYRFIVDPQEQHWLSRLRHEICLARYGSAEKAAQLVLTVGGEKVFSVCQNVFPETTSVQVQGTALGLELLAKAPVYSLQVALERTTAADHIQPPPRPDYALPYGIVAETATAVPAKQSSDAEAALIAQLTATLRDLLAKRLPQSLSDSPHRDLETVQTLALQHLISAQSFGGEKEQRAFWQSTKCPDRAAAATELSREVACQMVQLNLGAETAPEVTKSVLVGCNLWDDLHHRITCWRKRPRCFRTCPVEAEEEEDAFYIGSALGGDAKHSTKLAEKLIQSSMQDVYAAAPAVAPVACAQDDQPDHRSFACAANHACYMRRRDYQLDCNTSLVPLATRRVVLNTRVVALQQQQQAQQQQQQQVVVLDAGAALVGAGLHGRGTGGRSGLHPSQKETLLNVHASGKRTQPTSVPMGQALGSGEPVVQRVECQNCFKQPGVKRSDCAVCGGKGKKAVPPAAAATTPAQSLLSLPVMPCAHCVDAAKPIGQDLQEEAPQGMPEHGKMFLSVSFPSTGTGYEVELQSGLVVHTVKQSEASKQLELLAKVYRVELRQNGKKLASSNTPLRAQRNSYRLEVVLTPSVSFELKLVDRFTAQKEALASKMLRDASVRKLLTEGHRGIVFLPSDEALARSARAPNLDAHIFDLPQGASLEQYTVVPESGSRPPMITRGKVSFELDPSNTGIWKQCDSDRVKVLAMLPQGKDLVLVVLDGTAADVSGGR